jgi:hypothetical protein
MRIIREVDFGAGSVEYLAKKLDQYHAAITYSTGEEVLMGAEIRAYNPGQRVLENNLRALTEHFTTSILPILDRNGVTLRRPDVNHSTHYRAITKTSRAGDHSDFYVVRSELEWDFSDASLFRTLFNFDERGFSLLLDQEGNARGRYRVEDKKGNLIIDLQEFYSQQA